MSGSGCVVSAHWKNKTAGAWRWSCDTFLTKLRLYKSQIPFISSLVIWWALYMSQKIVFSLIRNFVEQDVMNSTIKKINFQFFIRANYNFSKFYNKSLVFDTHFFVFVIRIKLFLMSLLTMAFKKSFLYKTYSLWTFF